MDKRILLGQAHSTRVKTKEGKNYLVVGVPCHEKLRCKDLDTLDYVNINRADVDEVLTDSERTPFVGRVF